MKLYAIAWVYNTHDDDGYHDFGICDEVFVNEEKAQARLNACVEDSFNDGCAEGWEPKMTHDPDYARVDYNNGSYYEYKLLIIHKED